MSIGDNTQSTAAQSGGDDFKEEDTPPPVSAGGGGAPAPGVPISEADTLRPISIPDKTNTNSPVAPTPSAPPVDESSAPVLPQGICGDPILLALGRQVLDGVEYPFLASQKIYLTRRLGNGGMGAVYLGMTQKLRKEVAVKILNVSGAADPAFTARFKLEAQLAAQVRSPHLVEVDDADEELGLHYIVMQYVCGKTAAEWLSQERVAHRCVTEADALKLCIAATQGLATLHSKGIVHRDIKPGNIFIPYGDDGVTLMLDDAKLGDLGLARKDDAPDDLTIGHVVTPVTMGTPGYVSPEQIRSSKLAGKPTDVFSMGATLYTLLAGKQPWTGDSTFAVLEATINRPFEPISTLRNDLSAGLLELIATCLQKDPEKRYKDGAALLTAMQRVAAGPVVKSETVAPTIVKTPIVTPPVLSVPSVEAPQKTIPTPPPSPPPPPRPQPLPQPQPRFGPTPNAPVVNPVIVQPKPPLVDRSSTGLNSEPEPTGPRIRTCLFAFLLFVALFAGACFYLAKRFLAPSAQVVTVPSTSGSPSTHANTNSLPNPNPNANSNADEIRRREEAKRKDELAAAAKKAEQARLDELRKRQTTPPPPVVKDPVTTVSKSGAYQFQVLADGSPGSTPLRSAAMRKELHAKNFSIALSGAKLSQNERLTRLDAGQADLAVVSLAPVGLLRKAADGKDWSLKNCVLILSESTASHALVAHETGPRFIEQFNDGHAVLFGPDAPDMVLGKTASSAFSFSQLPPQMEVAASAEDVFNRFKTSPDSWTKRVFVLPQPLAFQAERSRGRILIESAGCEALVASNAILTNRPAELAEFLKGYFRALAAIESTPGGMENVIVQTMPNATPSDAQRMVAHTRWLNATENYSRFGMSQKGGAVPETMRNAVPLTTLYTELFHANMREENRRNFVEELTLAQWQNMRIVAPLRDSIRFARGVEELTAANEAELMNIAATLNVFPECYVIVRGNNRNDRELAKRRAELVKTYLSQKCGVDKNRLYAEVPLVSDDTTGVSLLLVKPRL